MKGKSVLQRNLTYFQKADSIKETYPKISYTIKTFAVNEIFNEFKKDASALNDTEKKEFQGIITNLKAEKSKLGENPDSTQEEYEEFLENMFANVDDEDRYGEVTNKTIQAFRFVSDLIDVLKNYGEIDDEWNKKSKYII
jgi:hypothetical protein